MATTKKRKNTNEDQPQKITKITDIPPSVREKYGNVDSDVIVPQVVIGDPITDEELQRRTNEIIVPPPFIKNSLYTSSQHLVESVLRVGGLAFPFISAFDKWIRIIPDQWILGGRYYAANCTFEFINARLERPEHNGKPLYPWFSRMHQDVHYAATLYVTQRITDNNGNVREIEINMGKLPVMIGSVLCNLHPSNINWDDERWDKNIPYYDRDVQKHPYTDKEREKIRLHNFYRQHNESTTDDVAYFIIKGMETVGISVDKQRNGIVQITCTPKRGIVARFIAVDINCTHSVELCIPQNKKRKCLPVVRVHVAEFMREKAEDNNFNVLILFVLQGWSMRRVRTELRKFVPSEPSDAWDRINAELELTFLEMEMMLGENAPIDAETGVPVNVLEYVISHMRDKGRNPLTNRQFTFEQMRTLLFTYLLRHMNDGYLPAEEVTTAKLRFLLLMVSQMLLQKIGVNPPPNRDAWDNKKLVTIVRHMQSLMARHIQEVVRLAKRSYTAGESKRSRKIVAPLKINLEKLDEANYAEEFKKKYEITNTFVRSMTGNSWGVFMPASKSKPVQIVCTAKLKRDSLWATISQGRKTNKNVNNQVGSTSVRFCTPASFELVDPLEVPDGEMTGLSEHISIVTHITTRTSDAPIMMYLQQDEAAVSKDISETHQVVLLVNGALIGWCTEQLERKLRREKQLGRIDIYASICLTHIPVPTLRVCTDEGRLTAPVLVVNPDTGALRCDTEFPGCTDFQFLLSKGCIEYLDAEERTLKQMTFDRRDLERRTKLLVQERKESLERLQNAQKAAEGNNTTHIAHAIRCEQMHRDVMRFSRIDYVSLDPSVMFGVSACLSLLVHHNSAVRASFGAGQAKQAIGVYATNTDSRSDVHTRRLTYGTIPINLTVVGKYLGMNEAYHSANTTTLVRTGPYTQEDSVVTNAQAMQALLYGFISTRCKDFYEKPDSGIVFGVAPGKWSYTKYRNIDPRTGIPIVGSEIREDEVIMAAYGRDNNACDFHMGHGERGIVDSVHIKHNNDSKQVTIVMRVFHIAGVGDKVSPYQGQKAVIGEVRENVDMPQIYGRPDIVIQQIVNPVPITGRVTISSVFELRYGRTLGISGLPLNGTPFTPFNPTTYERIILQAGLSPTGMERLLLPDGRITEGRLFVGRIAYMALLHLVSEKYHVRGYGPNDPTTGQPVARRVCGGGLRFGSMESGQCNAIGCTAQLLQRLMNKSDKSTAVYCSDCSIRYTSLLFSRSRCRNCKSKNLVKTDHPQVWSYLESIMSMVGIRISRVFA